jgi:hypothetical protein
MATPLDNFRNEYPDAFTNYTDDELVQYLYENDTAYKDMDYNQFKTLATAPGQEPVSPKPSQIKKTGLARAAQLYTTEPRKVIAGVSETLIGGTADLVEFASELALGRPLAKETKQAKRDNISKVLQSMYGQNIFTETEDDDGIKYLSAKKQTDTTVGTAAELVGSIAASFIGGKKGIIEPITKRVLKDPKDISKKAQRFRTGATTWGAAELSTQTILTPEEASLSLMLGEFVEDDSLLGSVFDMLEASDDKTELEQRLGVLVEGGLIGGGISLAFSAPKIIRYLRGVKEKGPEAVDAFKNTANKQRDEVKPALTKQPNIDVIKELTYVDDTTFTGKLLNRTQRFWQNITTSRGLYTPEMHTIKMNADQEVLAWTARAEDLSNKLSVSIRDLAEDFKPTEENLNTLFDNYINQRTIKKVTGTTTVNGKELKTTVNTKVSLQDLPEQLRPVAEEIRTTIDELSGMLLQSKSIPAAMKKEIMSNIGRYTRKTYELFDNPNYRPTQEVYDRAVAYVTKQIRKNEPSAYGQSERQIREQAKARIDEFMGIGMKDKVYKHFNDMIGAPQAKKIFAERQNIAKPLRDLFGETKDTPTAVFRTIEKMSSFYHQTKMYDDFLQAGKGKYFFRDKGKYSALPEGADKRFLTGKIEGQQYHTLDGWKTTPEIQTLFQSVDELSKETNGLFRLYFGMKGNAQAAATVGSWYTHIRNTIGGGVIMARNGMNPFSKDTREAFVVLQNRFKNASNQEGELNKLYEEFLRLGLVNQSVRVGDFKALINDAVKITPQNVVTNQKWYVQGLQNAKTKALSPLKFAEKLYTAEDDIWRIAGFEKELRVLKQANELMPVNQKKPEALLRQEAAQIIRNTMPTYSLVPPAAKALRKMPIGNFFSFHAEQFRNMYYSTIQARKEIFSGNEVLEARGYKRLAGITSIGAAGGVGLEEGTKFAYGVTTEEHEAVRALALPEWAKGSNLAYGRNPITGELYYSDLQFVDPTAPVVNLIRSSLNELLNPNVPNQSYAQRMLEATAAGVGSFLKPFVSETLLTEAMLDGILAAVRGDAASGRKIDGYEVDGGIENMLPIFMHIFETQIPATLKQLDPTGAIGSDKLGNQIYKQITENNPRTQYGNDLSIGTELLVNATGLRFNSLGRDSLQKSLEFKMKELNRAHSSTVQNIGNSIAVGKSYQDVLDAFKDQNNKYYKKYVSGQRAIEAAKTLKIKSFEINKVLKDNLSNFDKTERLILNKTINAFQPVDLSDSLKNKILKTNSPAGMSYKQFIREYNKLSLQFNQLPILVIPEDEREGKSSGGLIEGKDNVPFTKEDPANRINPYTGEAYSEEREPFAVGGFIKSVLSAVDANKLKKIKDIPETKVLDTRPEAYKMLDLDDKVVEAWKNERKREVNLKAADTGLPQRRERSDEVVYAAKDLKDGAIDVFEYKDVVQKNMPITSFKVVPRLTPIKEIAQALKSDQIEKGIVGLNKTFKDGEELALRLDIPAYDKYDSWIVSIHDGKTKSGAALAYAQTGWIKNVEFKTVPTAAFSIATGKPKGTIARMHGNWKQHRSEDAHTFVKEKLDSQEWTQVGMNPFRFSYFYDKADGMPVVAADEVIQVGPLVIAKNVTKASPDDEMFMAFSKKDNKRFKFSTGGLVDDRPEEELLYKMIEDGKERRINFNEGGSSMRENFLAQQQLWEGDHGDTPMLSPDEREINLPESEKTYDIAYGHKLKKDELESGKIYGIDFINSESKEYIPLTQEQKTYIQKQDIQQNLDTARKSGWDEKLKQRKLNWDSLDDSYKLVLEDLAYNVGGTKAGQTWNNIFDSIKNKDVPTIVNNLRRKENSKNTEAMDNRAAKAAYNAGLIKNLEEAKKYGLSLATTTEIPQK